MPNAGEIIRAGPVNTRRGTTTATTTTATFTAETVTDTLTVDLIEDARYLIEWYGFFASTVAADDVTGRLREDNVTGTLMRSMREDLPSANQSRMFYMRAEYTATATGSKTFVATGERAAGTGNITRNATATSPVLFTCDRILED